MLDKHPDAKCTRVAADLAQRRCVWPGRLNLAVSEKGGSFSQSLTLEAAAWVYLPGDRENWPQGMTLNGRTASALNKDEQPAFYLDAGEYVLRGNFDWNAMPQSLAIPAATALLDLNLNGKVVANPNLDGSRLWLRAQNDGADSGAHNSVKVEVFRKIADEGGIDLNFFAKHFLSVLMPSARSQVRRSQVHSLSVRTRKLRRARRATHQNGA